MENLIGWRILSAVDEVQPGKYAKARAQNWKSEYAPEFLMLEMMAQTGGLVVGAVRDYSGNVVFAKVENAEFSGVSAEELAIEAFAHDGVSEQGSWIDAQVTVGGNKMAAARFFLIDAGDLSGTGKSLTFHNEFLDYYQVEKKTKSNHEPRTTNHA